MKYFLDTEFLEGQQRKRIFGVPALELRWDETGHAEIYKPYTKPTIDLISIGIVAEDGREYYAISKDFNLKEAWNRFQLKATIIPLGNIKKEGPGVAKVYWLRENVLKPIFKDMLHGINPAKHDIFNSELKEFNYRNFNKLLSLYGKTNKQIAEEIKAFCIVNSWHTSTYSREQPFGFTKSVKKYFNYEEALQKMENIKNDYVSNGAYDLSARLIEEKDYPEFYAYYADYDWVVFCWLFGKMIDLPAGFPMYCRDLKQVLDEKAKLKIQDYCFGDTEEEKNRMIDRSIPGQVESFKTFKNYPQQENEHNALSDARWNKKLYEFLNNL
ncbi:hypothetical protein [Flavobacterium sp.]|uniref:hypothetical protein n=1 Tax=Flavobacterium sp. TaxID=239 RepID=UPI003D6C4A0D